MPRRYAFRLGMWVASVLGAAMLVYLVLKALPGPTVTLDVMELPPETKPRGCMLYLLVMHTTAPVDDVLVNAVFPNTVGDTTIGRGDFSRGPQTRDCEVGGATSAGVPMRTSARA
jgi:hypothetical protein